MNSDQQFDQAFQLMAAANPCPGASLVPLAARRIPGEKPLGISTSTALAFMAATHLPHEFPSSIGVGSTHPLSMSHALRIKSVEYWLKLGEADPALKELEALPPKLWNHPSVVISRTAALEALGETGGNDASKISSGDEKAKARN